jgi:chromate reductase
MTLEQSSDNRLRVLAISGSLRTASFNTGLLRASREVAPDGMDMDIFDIRELPFYDGDLEAQGDPEAVRALKSAIRESYGVVSATPEYN